MPVDNKIKAVGGAAPDAITIILIVIQFFRGNILSATDIQTTIPEPINHDTNVEVNVNLIELIDNTETIIEKVEEVNDTTSF